MQFSCDVHMCTSFDRRAETHQTEDWQKKVTEKKTNPPFSPNRKTNMERDDGKLSGIELRIAEKMTNKVHFPQ